MRRLLPLVLVLFLVSGCSVLQDLFGGGDGLNPASTEEYTYEVYHSSDFVGDCLISARLNSSGEFYGIRIWQVASPACSVDTTYTMYAVLNTDERQMIESTVLNGFDTGGFVVYSNYRRYEIMGANNDDASFVLGVIRR